MDFPASTPPLLWRHTPEPVPYETALSRMQADVADIGQGGPERVWLLEHPPLYTAGSSAKDADLRDPARLPIFRTGRGGQWTYHGPGQRIAYVMLDLNRRHGTVPARDLHGYVEGLERWLIAVLAEFGVRGERRPGRVGVWVVDRRTGAEAKIAALGVRVSRWISWHGIALNVSPNLEDYGGIVPCGIRAFGVTSLRAQGVEATLEEVDRVLRGGFAQIFGV